MTCHVLEHSAYIDPDTRMEVSWFPHVTRRGHRLTVWASNWILD